MDSGLQPSGKAKYAWREIDRIEPPKRPAVERVADFQRTIGVYDEAAVRAQARRCIQCPHPVCVEVCPLNCPIPELLELTADGQFSEAATLFFATHNIPELVSHTCLGGCICENECILVARSEPVPIRAITRFLMHYGWKNGLAEPARAALKNQCVAVVGSGICGLVVADALSREGYGVTIFDSRQKPGGRMMNGLPGFRVDVNMVARRVELLRQRGIQFRMGIELGTEVQLGELRRTFDAVLLGFVRDELVPLEVPGADLRGVCQGIPFIAEDQPKTEVQGRKVVVVGGGDTAIDVCRVAVRRGAASVQCLYRRNEACLPADAEEYADAREEGVRFTFLSQPVEVLGNTQGHVTGLRCVRTQLTSVPKTGRSEVVPVPDTDFEIPADIVFVAYGFNTPHVPDHEEFSQLEKDERGCLVVDAKQMTNLPGVFAGGSVLNGHGPLVDVVQSAEQASRSIDDYLTVLRSKPDTPKSDV
jgi:glutamate synthase (NADPH/NADH) small chain